MAHMNKENGEIVWLPYEEAHPNALVGGEVMWFTCEEAHTSAFTIPNLTSGFCFMPHSKSPLRYDLFLRHVAPTSCLRD